MITREIGRFKNFATIPSCDLPMWRRRCFSLATISLGCAGKRHSFIAGANRTSTASRTARTAVATLPLGRQSAARSSPGASLKKNFDKAFRAINKRVARMRASGSIEPEDSVNRTCVIRWCLGNHRSESEMSGFQKTTISILFAVPIALANSSNSNTSRSSWRNPAICQLADSSHKITKRSKPWCSSIMERESDLRGTMKLTNS